MSFKTPYIYFTRGDLLVLNRPMTFDAVLFWNGLDDGVQPVTVTVTTSVLIHSMDILRSQIIGLLSALQYLGVNVELPYVLLMGNEELQIVVEKA